MESENESQTRDLPFVNHEPLICRLQIGVELIPSSEGPSQEQEEHWRMTSERRVAVNRRNAMKSSTEPAQPINPDAIRCG